MGVSNTLNVLCTLLVDGVSMELFACGLTARHRHVLSLL